MHEASKARPSRRYRIAEVRTVLSASYEVVRASREVVVISPQAASGTGTEVSTETARAGKTKEHTSRRAPAVRAHESCNFKHIRGVTVAVCRYTSVKRGGLHLPAGRDIGGPHYESAWPWSSVCVAAYVGCWGVGTNASGRSRDVAAVVKDTFGVVSCTRTRCNRWRSSPPRPAIVPQPESRKVDGKVPVM